MSLSGSLRLQGLVFSALALALTLLVVMLPARGTAFETVLLATLIFVLGIPHGALDVIFAKRLYHLASFVAWSMFCLAYVALAAAVVGAWWLFPGAFLILFLLASAFHFSGDLSDGAPLLMRLWYSGSMLVFPAWFHQAEVARLFGALVPGDVAWPLAQALHAMALPWCAGLVVTLIVQGRGHSVSSMEMLSVGLLAAVAPPLLSFTVFFCAMHSARHAIRSRAFAAHLAWRDLLKKVAVPRGFCALVGLLVWPTLQLLPLDTAVGRILFVALAALTVPHMVLIEQIRWAGWTNPQSPGV